MTDLLEVADVDDLDLGHGLLIGLLLLLGPVDDEVAVEGTDLLRGTMNTESE